eukprot:10187211-Heterocapsa_arctica.AAC.1
MSTSRRAACLRWPRLSSAGMATIAMGKPPVPGGGPPFGHFVAGTRSRGSDLRFRGAPLVAWAPCP